MKYQMPPGVFDILPKDPKELWRCSYIWNKVESIIRKMALEFGYQEIRTPIFEKADLFLRSVGETSDIVSKEMYLFQDKGERLLSLRPEGTAPVMRAFIEHRLANQGQHHKFFYIGPMFRYDRPQAGRYRQHHQFGIEALGNRSPEQDAEVIALLFNLLKNLQLQDLDVQINCIGDKSARDQFKEALKTFLTPYLSDLSEDSQKRFETNPLRILDSKVEKDQEIVKEGPSILDFITDDNREHFEKTQELLTAINIPYKVNPLLVRGLDYYNELVFEVMTSSLGAQSSLGGGGRYDGLLKMMGGPDIPASGFGSGIERIIQAMIEQKALNFEEPRPIIFLIPMGESAAAYCFQLLQKLRQHEISAQMDFSRRKLGKAMQYANQIRARYVAVIGDNELETGALELKDMDAGTSDKIPIESLVRILRIIELSPGYMSYLEELDHPFDNRDEANYFVDKIYRSLQKTKQMTETVHDRVKDIKKEIETEATEE